MSEIAESECFHTFLKSGVKSLKEAHVVSNPQKAKRRSFLGIVKAPVTEDVQKAEVRRVISYITWCLKHKTWEFGP